MAKWLKLALCCLLMQCVLGSILVICNYFRGLAMTKSCGEHVGDIRPARYLERVWRINVYCIFVIDWVGYGDFADPLHPAGRRYPVSDIYGQVAGCLARPIALRQPDISGCDRPSQADVYTRHGNIRLTEVPRQLGNARRWSKFDDPPG